MGIDSNSGLDRRIYAFFKKHSVTWLKMVGLTTVVGAETIDVLTRNQAGDILSCSGLVKPTDATDGYAKGCTFIKTDAAAGTKSIYENTGTKDSCVFNLAGEEVPGDLVLTTNSMLVGVGGYGSALAIATDSVPGRADAACVNITVAEARVLARATGGHLAGIQLTNEHIDWSDGLSMSGNTGVCINLAPAPAGAGLKIHTHSATGATYDYANEFKGESVKTSGFYDGLAIDYKLSGSGTSIMRSVRSTATLSTGFSMTGADYMTQSWLVGGVFVASIEITATLNGAGVCVAGLYGGLSSHGTSTLTTAKYMTAIWGDATNWLNELGTGDSSLLLLTNNTGCAIIDYGINMVTADLVTTGMKISGGVTTGIDLTDATITPDASRTSSVIAIGDRLGAKSITMAAEANYNLDPVQMNLNIIGTAPTSSTVNGIYMNITHAFADMANLRLKCADWTIMIDNACQDAYVIQTELVLNGDKASSELIAVSALTTLGAGARTADRVCALQAMINADGTAGTVTGDCFVGYFVNAGIVRTTDSIVKLYNQSAAETTNFLLLDNDCVTAAYDPEGIVLEGRFLHGIQMSNMLLTQGSNQNSFISIGGYGTAPIEVTLDGAHCFAKNTNLELQADAAYSLIGDYCKVSLGGNAAATAQLVAYAARVTVDEAVESAYGLQSHMTISGDKASSELIAVSALATLGTGARTADRVCALQAMITGDGTAGTVVGDCIVAYLANAGTVITTDSILELKNQSAATVVAALTMDLDGTVTYAIDFDGTVSDAWTTATAGTSITPKAEYVLIPVKVKGTTNPLFLLAAQTFTVV